MITNSVKVKIRKFNIRKLKPDRTVVLLGKRGTGKSVLMNDLLGYLSTDFDMGVGMSPTEETLEAFREVMPNSMIYEGKRTLHTCLNSFVLVFC